MYEDDIKVIEKHKAIWEKERDRLTKLISQANNLYYELKSGENKFKCPEGKANKDAVCSECDKVLPEIHDCKNVISVTFPNQETQEVDFIDVKGRYCKEWQKKIITNACGCGGEHTCICGYVSTFCIREQPKACPFCGRITTVKLYPNLFESINLGNMLLKVNLE